MRYDFRDTAVFWCVFFCSLLSEELILVLEACNLQIRLAVVANYMVTDFELFGELSVLHANEAVVSSHLALAVEQEALPSLDLDARLSALDLAQADAGPLQVDIDAALLAGDLGSFSHHLDQDFMLLILDLRCIDPANVHALPEKL